MSTYLGGECLDRLQVEVVVEMEVVEVLAVDEEVEHVVALATHLQTNLHPVQLGRLEELGRLERPEQVPTTHGHCLKQAAGSEVCCAIQCMTDQILYLNYIIDIIRTLYTETPNLTNTFQMFKRTVCSLVPVE